MWLKCLRHSGSRLFNSVRFPGAARKNAHLKMCKPQSDRRRLIPKSRGAAPRQRQAWGWSA
jgi:hypothetical protein